MDNIEYLIGYDIREKKWTTDIFDDLKSMMEINQYYSRYAGIWNSCFQYGGILSKEIIKTHYREPKTQNNTNLVYFEYCNEFFHIALWDNMNNMLCRKKLTRNDALLAFSVIFPNDKIITCQGLDLLEQDDSKYFSAMAISEINNFPLNYPDKWSIIGYDIGNLIGYNPYMHSLTFDEIKEISAKENYTIWQNRNSFGLLDDLNMAIEECRIINAYDEEHCPYYIWKVYDALPGATAYQLS